MDKQELIELRDWLTADEIDDAEDLFAEVDTIIELIEFWLDNINKDDIK